MKFLVCLLTIVATASAAATYGVSGGRDAAPGESPWILSLQINSNPMTSDTRRHMCGGALVSKSWVLTSASCVKSNSIWNNIIEIDGGLVQQHDPQRQRFTISKTVRHPDFNMSESRTPSLNDIALVKLDRDVELNENLATVQLPEENADLDNTKEFNFTGWFQASTNHRQILQITSLPFLNFDECSKLVTDYVASGEWEAWDRVVLDEDTSFCTGPKSAETMQLDRGDNGGPLVQDGVVYGVLSYKLDGYVYHHDYYTPSGIFTKVSKYVSWIKEVVDDL